ncbi:MAG: CcmD family protein [Sphingomonadales bacterium]|jgi:CcmD family protein
MKKKSIFQTLLLLLLCSASPLLAQNSPMRGNAKFNVVASVLIIIFAGIIGYLIYLDRKVSSLEKEKENQL